MKSFIIRRLLLCMLILIGVSIVVYTLIRLMPGDYVEIMAANNPNTTAEMIQNLKSLYGLDTNIFTGYLSWFSKAIRGNFGESFIYKRPVTQVIASKMWISFFLAIIAFILQIFIAIPLGIFAAIKQYSKTDYFITFFALLGISMPSFFFAAVLQKILALEFKIFPLQGMINARADYTGLMNIIDIGYHFCLPILVFVITSIGGLMRYSRTNMLEVLNADFIRTARAKGLSEKTVMYRHAFRNTLIPLVTMIGGLIPSLFSGAIITEQIFAIDGLGYTAFQALKAGDIPFIMGFNMFLAVLTLFGTLLSDVLYAVVDPRVRLG
ncbi:MAG: ABC transporter permease [Treponemataceae bacterium]